MTLHSLFVTSVLVAAAIPAAADTLAAALIDEIPFHPSTPASRVMIDLAPEGHQPFVMMLDTGASGSVLTPGTARALGVSVRKHRSSPYRKKTRLGRDLSFWVDTSWSDTSAKTGFEYGLLGGDFLDDYVLEIDYPGRVVRFYDPKKYEIPEQASEAGAQVLPFRRAGTRILVDLEVEGKTILTLLDTGAPAVLLSGKEAKKAGIEWKDLPELENVGGVLGPIKAYTYEAEELRLAGFAFAKQPIAIAPRGVYNQGGPTDSALGYDVLSRFVVRIDYETRRIWLSGEEEYAQTYWGRPQVAAAPPSRRTPTADEVAESDARARAKWEEARSSRRYAETPGGGFTVVEGHRLRLGPKEGEIWYTHEEMLARKKEREQTTSKP
jgi:predicted aspartyl protease